MNFDTFDDMVPIRFQESIPNRSWYRHRLWPVGMFKLFRAAHTMSQNIEGFEFYMKNETIETAPSNASEEIQYPQWETAGDTTPEQNEARFGN